MRKLFGLLMIGMWSFLAMAAQTCRITVNTTNAHGGGLRLTYDQSAGVYYADAPTDIPFTATVLPDEGYYLAKNKNSAMGLPEGVTYNNILGLINIPAKTLQANADKGIEINIEASPIFYKIYYHAMGDGAPQAVGATELLVVQDQKRTWSQDASVEAGTTVTLAGEGTLHAEGWKFLGWSRVHGQTTPDFKPGATVDHLTSLEGVTVNLYAVWQTSSIEGKVSYPVVLQNGDFESPEITTYYKHIAGAKITETEIVDINKIGWSTTAADNLVEIGRPKLSPTQYNVSVARDGQQIAELNANTASLLYQRIATLPNTTLHWGFSHRARGYQTTEETLAMWIGTDEQIQQARAIYNRFAHTSENDANHLSKEAAMAEVEALAQSLQFTNVVHTATTKEDTTFWYNIKGDYEVPTGHTVTEYAFVSWIDGKDGNGAPSYGNLIDRVYLSDAEPLETHDLTVTFGDGGKVWLNDSYQKRELSANKAYSSSYNDGTKLVLSLAIKPAFDFLGLMVNGKFLPFNESLTFLSDLSITGIKKDLNIDFVFVSDSLVEFRPNGGTYTDSQGEPISSIKLSVSRPTCTPGIPVRKGFNFLGWGCDKSGIVLPTGSYIARETEDGKVFLVCYSSDNTVLNKIAAKEGMILYAQWVINDEESYRDTGSITMVAVNAVGDDAIMKRVDGTDNTWSGKGYLDELFVTMVFPAPGFRLPDAITIRNENHTKIDDYKYNRITGMISIPGKLLSQNLEITVEGERISYKIVYSSGGEGEIAGNGVQKVPNSKGVWQQDVIATSDSVTLASQGELKASGWKFLGWARLAEATKAEFQAGASVPHLTRLDGSVIKLYGIWKADDGSIASSFPVMLQNGGFESPSLEEYYNNHKNENKTFYKILDEGVEGLHWNTTASDGKIELASVSTNLSNNGTVGEYHVGMARDGLQFAELNANQVGALYQDVATVPGVKLYWGFSHKSREEGDALALLIGSKDDFEKALNIYTKYVSQSPAGWQDAVTNEIAQLENSSIQLTYHEAPYDVSDLTEWTDLTGVYTVPAGQNVTKFAFLSLSSNSNKSKGNLIDRVYFTTSEPIQTATLTILATAGGKAKVIDGSADYHDVTPTERYFKVVAGGQRVVISPIAEEGWSFLGCYVGNVYTPRAGCDNILNFEMPLTDRRITLIFAKERTITFNLEGGIHDPDSHRLSASNPEYTLTAATRTGYTFKGWKELTLGNIYSAGTVVKYEVEAQYDENVKSWLICGSGNNAVTVKSEEGLILNAVWEIQKELVEKKLVTFVDRDYTKAEPQPFRKLYHVYLAAGGTNVLKNVTGIANIVANTEANRPSGYEPTGWTYVPNDGSPSINFDFVERVFHQADGEETYLGLWAVTNGVLDKTFRFYGVNSMRFEARWDRFYDVTRMEENGVTTNRTAWVPKSWLDSKGYTAITETNYKKEIEKAGANGVPLWQSYIFGLDPNNALSVALSRPQNYLAANGKVAFSLEGIKVVKYLNDIYKATEGHNYRTYKVCFALMGTNNPSEGWTQVGDVSDQPTIELPVGDLTYRYYRVEARIMKKSE